MTDAKRKLFEMEKVPVILETIGHRKIKTKDGEMRMLDLMLKVEPLTPELAAELDPELRRTIFTMQGGEPRRMIRSLTVRLDMPQQDLHAYTTPDTERARILFDRCDVTNIVVRMIKRLNCFGLRFRVSFGMPSADVLEYVDANLYQQIFISTEQTDPDLFANYAAAGRESTPKLRKKREIQPDLAEVADGHEPAAETPAAAGPRRLPITREKEPRRSHHKAKASAGTAAKKRSHHKKR